MGDYMLKRLLRKKITILFAALFTISLICLLPEDKSINIETELTYINSNLNSMVVFLMDKNNFLARTSVTTDITFNSIEEKATELIKYLTIDSENTDKLPNGFKAVIPSDTKILSIDYKDSVIKIDFSSELMDTSIDMEEKIIEAIVYNLTSIDEVKYVIIYMNGIPLTKLPQSNITLPDTLDRNFGINKEYDITSKNDISKTTVYYINKNNDDIYYVPVTKVNNDKRDKIEIIIDELTSSNLYKTNLMSYLNSQAKLISVTELENELDLEFNSYIFNDLDNENILEEVIYTLALSISDNYPNINEAVIMVNNKEICKTVLNTLE
jgi:germination protein M